MTESACVAVSRSIGLSRTRICLSVCLALESLHSGQITLSTLLIKPNILFVDLSAVYLSVSLSINQSVSQSDVCFSVQVSLSIISVSQSVCLCDFLSIIQSVILSL